MKKGKFKWVSENMSDDDFVAIMEDVFDWMKPNIKKTKEGKEYDANYKNVFFIDYLISEHKLIPVTTERILKARPWLRDYYDVVKHMSASKLYQLGLEKTYDSALVKFGLTVNHNWVDKMNNINENNNKYDLKDLIKFK